VPQPMGETHKHSLEQEPLVFSAALSRELTPFFRVPPTYMKIERNQKEKRQSTNKTCHLVFMNKKIFQGSWKTSHNPVKALIQQSVRIITPVHPKNYLLTADSYVLTSSMLSRYLKTMCRLSETPHGNNE
jgi:hypothetical protein